MNKRIQDIKFNGEIYDLSPNVNNTMIKYDDILIKDNIEDIYFVYAVFKWKEKFCNQQNLNFNNIRLQSHEVGGELRYYLEYEDDSIKFYFVDSIIPELTENIGYTIEELKLETEYMLDSPDEYVTLYEYLVYMINTSKGDIALDMSKLNEPGNIITNEIEDIKQLSNIYQVINYFQAGDNSAINDRRRIRNITDYSAGSNQYIKPRTTHATTDISDNSVIANDPVDSDIVLMKHIGEKSETAEDRTQYQRVRLYKEDGAAEFGTSSAKGISSFAQGNSTEAKANYSAALGSGTVTNKESETAVGTYNVNESNGNHVFTVGIGSNDSNRADGFYVTDHGEVVARNTVRILGTGDNNTDNELVVGNDAFHVCKNGRTYVGGYLITYTPDTVDTVNNNNIDSYKGNRFYRRSFAHSIYPTKDYYYSLGYEPTIKWEKDTEKGPVKDSQGNTVLDENGQPIYNYNKKLETIDGIEDSLRWNKLYVKEIIADVVKTSSLSGLPENKDNIQSSSTSIDFRQPLDLKDTKVNGNVYAKSVYGDHFHTKNKGFVRIQSPLEALGANQWYDGDTCSTVTTTVNGKTYHKNQEKNKGYTRAALLAQHPKKNSSVLSQPKIYIDKNSGDMQFNYSGYVPYDLEVYNRYRHKDSSGNAVQDRTRICKFFKHTSFIMRAIGRNIPMTVYSNDGSAYDAFIDCYTDTQNRDSNNVVNDNIDTVREAWDAFVARFGEITNFEKSNLDIKFLLYHSLYIEAMEKQLDQDIINKLKILRDTAVSNVFKSELAKTEFKRLLKDEIQDESNADSTGRGFLKIVFSDGDNTSGKISKGTYLSFSGTCHTNLCYEDLEFIQKLSDEFKEVNSDGVKGFPFEFLLLSSQNRNYLSSSPIEKAYETAGSQAMVNGTRNISKLINVILDKTK